MAKAFEWRSSECPERNEAGTGTGRGNGSMVCTSRFLGYLDNLNHLNPPWQAMISKGLNYTLSKKYIYIEIVLLLIFEWEEPELKFCKAHTPDGSWSQETHGFSGPMFGGWVRPPMTFRTRSQRWTDSRKLGWEDEGSLKAQKWFRSWCFPHELWGYGWIPYIYIMYVYI